MSRLPVFAAGALLAIAGSAHAGQTVIQMQRPGGPVQIVQPNRDAKTGTGRIRGRVLAADTNAPVRRAQVRIIGEGIGGKLALTDAEGRYEFRDLPVGRFRLLVAKPGFVPTQYGQRHPLESGRPIELSDGEALDNVNIVLPRGGVLTGRIVDEFGDPLEGVEVMAQRRRFINGAPRLAPAGRGVSNDLGDFRIYGLAPGQYYVSASLRSPQMVTFDVTGAAAGGPVGSMPDSGYAPTYYPGTPSSSDAQPIAIGPGQEVDSLDFAMQAVKTVRIRGTVMSSAGQPVGGARVVLIPAVHDSMSFAPAGTSRTASNGTFTMTGIAPGDYTLETTSNDREQMMIAVMTGTADATSRPARREPEFAAMPLSVNGTNIDDLVVTTARGAHATGRLVFEGQTAPPGLSKLRILAVPAGSDVRGPVGTSTVKDDGTFELTGLSGARGLRAGNLPRGWFLDTVEYDGADVTDTGIEFKPGTDVSGIVIRYTQQQTHLTGTVATDAGIAATDYTILVFSQDPHAWTQVLGGRTREARPDQDGQFKIDGLRPGDYYAIALESVDEGQAQDPEFLTRISKDATSFTLEAGASKALQLKLSR
ncbi:MAG TPA: carboxypeptidase-like regulatory domain-containing protein [Vicinamibacterales bacterium]|nr:carboxypeptidase-like regulatory domain-containing protein [Vicinamibacterales bacterium]